VRAQPAQSVFISLLAAAGRQKAYKENMNALCLQSTMIFFGAAKVAIFQLTPASKRA